MECSDIKLCRDFYISSSFGGSPQQLEVAPCFQNSQSKFSDLGWLKITQDLQIESIYIPPIWSLTGNFFCSKRKRKIKPVFAKKKKWDLFGRNPPTKCCLLDEKQTYHPEEQPRPNVTKTASSPNLVSLLSLLPRPTDPNSQEYNPRNGFGASSLWVTPPLWEAHLCVPGPPLPLHRISREYTSGGSRSLRCGPPSPPPPPPPPSLPTPQRMRTTAEGLPHQLWGKCRQEPPQSPGTLSICPHAHLKWGGKLNFVFSSFLSFCHFCHFDIFCPFVVFLNFCCLFFIIWSNCYFCPILRRFPGQFEKLFILGLFGLS